jgi:hypothetical protein
MTIEAKTKPTSDNSDLDPASLAAIRDLLATEPEVAPQPVKERMAEKAEAAFAPLSDTPAAYTPRRVAAVPEYAELTQNASKTAASKSVKVKQSLALAQNGFVAGIKAKVTSYRPTVLHIILAVLALTVFFRPWLVLGIVFLAGFVMTGVFLILGYDGFWRRAMGVARWYARKRPTRSVELHRKLDSFAMKWDAVLDRFPEGSVDGLYLPDFGDLAAADARHDAALDRRFDSLRETEA